MDNTTTATPEPAIITDNFFGLDKENGKYYTTGFGNGMILLVLKGDEGFIRRASNMICSFIKCRVPTREAKDMYYVSLTREKLVKAFSLYFYAELYKTSLAKKEDIYEKWIDEEGASFNIWNEIKLLNEDELSKEADRLAESFVANCITNPPAEFLKYFKNNYNKDGIDMHISFERDSKTKEIQRQLDSEDGEKFIEQLFSNRASD